MTEEDQELLDELRKASFRLRVPFPRLREVLVRGLRLIGDAEELRQTWEEKIWPRVCENPVLREWARDTAITVAQRIARGDELPTIPSDEQAH